MELRPMQQIFMVFYAIFWGSVANVLGRWKAFDTGNFCRDRWATKRLLLALGTLNVLPLLYFTSVLWFLSKNVWLLSGWGLITVLKVLLAVFAAWGFFGFYRIWLFAVQRHRTCFYPVHRADTEWRRKFRQLDPEYDLDQGAAWRNFAFGIIHLGLPLLVLLVVMCFAG